MTHAPVQRVRRGVYYTSPPVVRCITRNVNHLLKADFDLSGGLADRATFRRTKEDVPVCTRKDEVLYLERYIQSVR